MKSSITAFNFTVCDNVASGNEAAIKYSNATHAVHSLATISCTAGYRITNGTGNNDTARDVTCNANGQWNTTYACEPKGIYKLVVINAMFEPKTFCSVICFNYNLYTSLCNISLHNIFLSNTGAYLVSTTKDQIEFPHAT
jgi:hypothetical protein